MLFRFLKSLLAARRRDPGAASDDHPLARQQRIRAAHAAAPLPAHLEILYGDLKLGEARFLDVLKRALRDSETLVSPLKAFRRPLASYFLARYFLHARQVPGAIAECGVFRGSSALLLCHVARLLDSRYQGEGLHLIDSFEGLSAPGSEDRIAGGEEEEGAPRAKFEASLESVQRAFGEFPRVAWHRGWIPAAFGGLPDGPWAFVHIDVDLYQPTYDSLEYFHPRLANGGVIVCDDYGAPTFPGAARAWDRFCAERDARFVVLDTGQAVLLKGA